MSVAFAPGRFARGADQEYMFRMSMIAYPIVRVEGQRVKSGSTICRFQLTINGEIYLRLKFKCNGIIHADSNMFDKLDSHVNAKGKISNLYKTVKNEVRRRNGYEMVWNFKEYSD